MPKPDFYPRSPCGERRGVRLSCFAKIIFLSTLSLRRATNTSIAGRITSKDFYPRSPCGERHNTSALLKCQVKFLSTLSLRRATYILVNTFSKIFKFLSTLSLRRATSSRCGRLQVVHYFYPRSPCGERLHYDNYNLHCVEISIHALLAESDAFDVLAVSAMLISIHALLAESDSSGVISGSRYRHFYPRSPCGERQ